MTWLPLALTWLAYVVTPEVALQQLALAQAPPASLRVNAALAGIGADWPEQVVLEIHPRLGVRVWDDRGDRWLMRGDRVVAGTRPEPPWIPELSILGLDSEPRLAEFLQQHGIDGSRNELGRCGEWDCFVIGGRTSSRQLWVEKDLFRVRRLRLAEGRTLEFHGRSWGQPDKGPWFPQRIDVFDEIGKIGSLTVESVERAEGMRSEDFTAQWVRGSQAP